MKENALATGPLTGFRVLELAGIGPGPLTGMMLADMGAEVIRIERKSEDTPASKTDPSYRGKRSIAVDLKSEVGVEVFLKLVESADAVIEGYRPGVAERLGIGPNDCRERNRKIVYGRVTGWGQEGPLAQAAGHDINYIALTGALHAIGRPGQPPVPPLNLIGDMGGGGFLLTIGILAALLEAQKSGEGQVVDAAMVDGAALQMWMFHGFVAMGFHSAEHRGVNLLDGGSHFYDSYETADGKYVAIGAIEPEFYAKLLELVGVDDEDVRSQMDHRRWGELKAKLAGVFKTRSRDEWCEILEGTDACFAPVLTMTEAPQHPHMQARETYSTVDGFVQPSPAPRFERTPSSIRHGNRSIGSDTDAVLAEAGYAAGEIESLRESGVLT